MNRLEELVERFIENKLKYINEHNGLYGVINLYCYDENSQYMKMIEKQINKLLPSIVVKKYILKEKTTEHLINTVNGLNKEASAFMLIAPFPTHIDVHRLMNSVDENKDLDKLGSKYDISKKNNLPITPYVLLELMDSYLDQTKNHTILLIGKGLTVNGKLFQHLLMRKNYFTFVKGRLESPINLYKCADFIISSTGVGELLNSSDVYGKPILSPTITKNKDGVMVSDVSEEIRDKVITTKTLGTIGKLTTLECLCRLVDVIKYNS